VTQSSPQPDAPPRLVLDVMRWMPKPAVRTVLGLAVAGLAFLYLRGRQHEVGLLSSSAWKNARPTSPGRFKLNR
jgi:hypothetical protein